MFGCLVRGRTVRAKVGVFSNDGTGRAGSLKSSVYGQRLLYVVQRDFYRAVLRGPWVCFDFRQRTFSEFETSYTVPPGSKGFIRDFACCVEEI